LPFRDRITVVHDGIDTEAVRPDPNVTITLGNGLALSRNDEVVTFVNRNLEPYRGYHTFMRALPSLLRQRPNAQLLIVGGDSVSYGAKPAGDGTWKTIFANEVRPQISDADWARVHFLGNLPYQQFIPLLQLSTVHVYLTYPFVLSWSLLEAMSAGCTIMASDTAPLREAIRHNETGLLVDFFDANALAEQVGALLADTQTRKKLGENARVFARAHYDLRTQCLPGQIAWVEQLHNR
jgi:glycosyltransferase involved in cell wall biosynthesis